MHNYGDISDIAKINYHDSSCYDQVREHLPKALSQKAVTVDLTALDSIGDPFKELVWPVPNSNRLMRYLPKTGGLKLSTINQLPF